MLTLKEALAIAKSKKGRINHCVEYTNAYMFSWDTGEETDGGDAPIVVMKETGETMNMSAYIWTPDKEYVGEHEIE